MRRRKRSRDPDCSRFERLIVRFEVQVMHGPHKVFWSFESSLDERLVDDHRGSDVRRFTSLPCFFPLSHRLEVSPHSIDADRDRESRRGPARFRDPEWVGVFLLPVVSAPELVVFVPS